MRRRYYGLLLLGIMAWSRGALGDDSPPRLPMLDPATAWRKVVHGSDYPKVLPEWARIWSGLFPKTTAYMLNLDGLHRSGDRLDARLRCLARWAAAEANGCRYAQSIAESDWRRAGQSTEDIASLVAQPERLPEIEKHTVALARRMMREAHAITDEEVQRLISLLGEERTVALVTLLAHASFQDRFFLSLGLTKDSDGALPPLTVPLPSRPPKGTRSSSSPEGSSPPKRPELPELITRDSPQWRELQQGLGKQRRRPTRIRVPPRETVLARLGPDHPAAWQAEIVWSRVCFGYQPELTAAWFETSAAFREESRLPPMLSNSIFWVVTQAVKCFY